VGSGFRHGCPPQPAAGACPGQLCRWNGGCECQGLWNAGHRNEAYNEVHCSRLAAASGDRRGLAVHASAALRSGDRLLGILNVAGPDWASFSPRALALLSSVAGQMGIALERARLFDLLRDRRIDEQATLLDVSNQLLGRLDLDEVIDYLVEEVPRLLRADAAALLLPADEPDMLTFCATSGWRSDPVAAGYRVSAGEHSSPGLAMRTRQPVLARDVEEDASAFECSTWLHSEGFHATPSYR